MSTKTVFSLRDGGRYRTKATRAEPMPVNARLHFPKTALGNCVCLGVERDTRGLRLTDAQRFNYYPATPMAVVSWTFEGDLHMVGGETLASAVPCLAPALPRVVLSGPQRKPTASWSPGAVHALSVGFYPEALSSLFGINVARLVDKIVPLEAMICEPLLNRFLEVGSEDDRDPFHQVEAVLKPFWQGVQRAQPMPIVRGWLQAMVVRAAFTKSGASIRRAQRLFKHWTGQSYRDLQLYERVERFMAHACTQPHDEIGKLASIAADAGFADQSHLSREVRRVTGVSPKRLSELMRSEEAFWYYRLLSEDWHHDLDARSMV
jgi:AraC-like DNA-binding protein